MVKPTSNVDEKGLTETTGHWRCAAKYLESACLYKWTDDGVGRVLILTDLDEVRCGKEYACLFLGNVSAEQDHILNMLRAAKLLKTAQWNTTKEALLHSIRELNEACEKN